MKKKFILFCSCILGISSFVLVSCTDIDLTNISEDLLIEESLVLPVGEGSLTVGEVLGKFDFQNMVGYDADTINFQYEINKEYEFQTFNLLGNAVTKAISLPLTPTLVPANTSLPIPGGNQFTVDLGLNPNSTISRTDSANITAATFSVKLSVTNIKDMSNNNVLPSDLKIRFVFPNMHYVNSVTAITKDIPVTQFGAFTDVIISDFVLNTTGLTGVPFQVQLITGNRNINIGSNAKIDIDVKISQLNLAVAYGLYEPASTLPTSIKMPLEGLAELPAGLRFANPTATIVLQSNFGSYLRFNIDYIKAFSKDRSIVKQAMFNGNPTIFEVIDVKPTIPGQFVSKTLRKLDRYYGTTDQLFDTETRLDTLEYKFSIQNDAALNNASLTPGFIVPALKIKTNFKLKVPFFLKSGSNATLSDTIKGVEAAFNKIEKATLVLKVTNRLPVKVSFTLEFLDENKQTINSSINTSAYTINSGEVNTDGLVTKETITPLNIELTKEQVAELKDAKSMVYSIQIAGQDATKAIQFTKSDFFKVKLGVSVKSKYKTSLDSIN